MRAKPPFLPAPRERKPEWTCSVQVVLITRLFGGGAKTREIDPLSWLRSSAAKSALRAWWRAGHAHEFSSLADLRAREEALFGASATFDEKGRPQKGPGMLEIVTQSHRGSDLVKYDESPGSVINYGLFPAAPMNQPAAWIVNPSDQMKAVITLISRTGSASDQEALLDGLRLWLTLGGVGARTRRGVGALAVPDLKAARELDLPGTLSELKSFLRQRCQRRAVPSALDGVFCLARTRRIFVGPTQASGEQAQKKLLTLLREARQARVSNRSTWPEGDAIRLKAGYSAKNADNAEQYPRAALGLPIVVHFKQPQQHRPTEPADHHILAAKPVEGEWKKIDRYSSPVLLRPVRVWENGRTVYVPVAIFTESTLPGNFRPLVVTDPRGELNVEDVVTDYNIQQDANATLRRIEVVFEKAPGFQSL